jgi:hypothetical protein
VIFAAADPIQAAGIDLQTLLSGAVGAAIITGIFGIVLALIGWRRGVRPDARAEMELALTQQRATIDRLSTSNDKLQTFADEALSDGRISQKAYDDMKVEITKTEIYIVRLEAYCDDLELQLKARGVIPTGRPVKPDHLLLVTTSP